MRHEPSGAIGAKFEVAHELMGRNALLARCHEVQGQEPLAKRDVRSFHDGAGAAGELVPAVTAEEHAGWVFPAIRIVSSDPQ